MSFVFLCMNQRNAVVFYIQTVAAAAAVVVVVVVVLFNAYRAPRLPWRPHLTVAVVVVVDVIAVRSG